MRRPWLWTFILGTLLGAGLVTLWLYIDDELKTYRSPFAETFDLAKLGEKAGPKFGWTEVLFFGGRDKDTALGEPKWHASVGGGTEPIGVSYALNGFARARIPPGEQKAFFDRLAQAVKEDLERHGATTRSIGSSDTFDHGEHRKGDRITFSDRGFFYQFANLDGAIRLMLIGDEDKVTIVVSLHEKSPSRPGPTRFWRD
jgi:hypothetical protein